MLNELLTMSQSELDRMTLIQKVSEKEVKQKIAANALGLSKRQIIGLVIFIKFHLRSAECRPKVLARIVLDEQVPDSDNYFLKV